MKIYDQLVKPCVTSMYLFQMEELFDMHQPTKRLVEDGKVFGVHKIGDQLGSARLTLENSHLLMHCRLDKPPPLDTYTIDVSRLRLLGFLTYF